MTTSGSRLIIGRVKFSFILKQDKLSWPSNLLRARDRMPVNLIILCDLTQECRIHLLIGTDITV